MATPRAIRPDDVGTPVYAVWELTIRCDHACAHCGSRAGAFQRPDELDRETALATARKLAALGTREVTLIGGEAYLSPHCLPVTRELVSHGVRVTMQTGGLGLTPARVARLKDAGVSAIGFSIDGPEAVHDVLRDRPGSFRAATAGMRNAVDAGLLITANSQVNRLNHHLLEETADLLHDLGARVWRAQLTVPMGRAADRPEWILEPWRVPELVETLARIQTRYAERAKAEGLPAHRIFDVQAGNNVGYYGPHEVLLRSRPGKGAAWWNGCQAGRVTLGIESDGTVKGCPSLPTAPYAGGKLTDLPLETLWRDNETVGFTSRRTVDELWGFCRTCYYAETCMAGCSFTAHATLGRRGNNPFCTYRATELAKRGRRERLVPVERAEGVPYDFGRFEIVEEDLPCDSPPST